MARIESDADHIGRRKLVAAPEAGGNRLGRPVVAAHRHVEESIVVGHLHDGALAERRHVVGLPLHEVLRRFRPPPHLVVETPVDSQGRRDPQRAKDLAGLRLDRRLVAAVNSRSLVGALAVRGRRRERQPRACDRCGGPEATGFWH